SPALFSRVLEAARRTGAAVAALPCTDTVKRAGGNLVEATVDRRTLWLAQTPQGFRVDLLREAWAAAGAGGSAATDEAALVEAAGHPVELVPGEKENFKVTDPEDWSRARALVEAPAAVGFGYDVHAFAEGRTCVLGGVTFPGEPGLAGHSDADAAVHAVMDAILGAAGLGDIGQHFPDSDERFRGASSLALLEEVRARIEEAGFRVLNVDLTIAAARPRIGSRREEMRERIASALRLPAVKVNVKATTTEGLGFVGRSEGIAAHAVALVGRS
ncbi:MAG TPA: 2-C-methyl-D-erythritol 2,4-cyclodiphosphate synthase, partial [Vulgatibacter sp.]